MRKGLADLIPVLDLVNDRAMASLAKTNAEIAKLRAELKKVSQEFSTPPNVPPDQASSALFAMRKGDRWVEAETIRINQKLASLVALAEEKKNEVRLSAGRLDAVKKLSSRMKR